MQRYGASDDQCDPVDGGHRAIKYTRIGGVQKDIYNEGKAASRRLFVVGTY